MFREGIDIGIDHSHLQQTDEELQQTVEEERVEEEKKLPPALFIQAPYGGDAIQFRGEPTSLLYAVSLFADRVHKGEVEGLSDSELKVMNPPVYDEQFKQELEKYLYENRPKVIGISCTTSSSVPAREIAETAKNIAAELGYQVIVVMGGAHERDIAAMQGEDDNPSSRNINAGTSAEQYRNVVDFSATGESEETFDYLLQQIYQTAPDEITNLSADELKKILIEHKDEFANLKGRDGGFAFSLDGQPVRIKTAEYRQEGTEQVINGIDLKNTPPLPRYLVDEKSSKYYGIFRKNGQDVKTAQIMTCRGCKGGCSFCSEHRRFNASSADKVKNEILDALDQKYEAIFFDDSTFTWFHENRTEEEVQLIFDFLKEKGIEWGCQTRVDKLDEGILSKMKEAGCTYIYLGAESADPRMLEAMHKGVTIEQIEKTIDMIDGFGIRIGLSYVFGTEGNAHENGEVKEVKEDKSSVDRTIAFIKRKLDEGVTISLVSMNLLTYYPDSYATKHMSHEDRIRVAAESYPERDDLETLSDEELLRLSFSRPIVRNGYPWNRFEDGQGHHPACITEELARYIVEHGVEEIGEVLQGQDLYVVPEIYEGIRTGQTEDYVDLNHSSITTPKLTETQKQYVDDPFYFFPDQRGAETRLPWDDTGISSANTFYVRMETYEKARAYVADMAGIEHDGHDLEMSRVVFTPNTTEAANTAFRMIEAHEKRRFAEDHEYEEQLSEQDRNIVVTNAENFSVKRIAKVSADQSNPHGRDDWSTYQDFGTQHTKTNTYSSRKTGYEVREASIRETGGGQEIIDLVDEHTQVVIFSHVVRDNGLIMDVSNICRQIKEKNPDCWIIVDGAQAFGALPPFKIGDLGCDFYIATPHKTLNSYPFGILLMSESGEKADEAYREALKSGKTNQVPRNGSFMFGHEGLIEPATQRGQRDLIGHAEILSPIEIRSLTAQLDPLLNGQSLTEEEIQYSKQGPSDSLGGIGMRPIPERTLEFLSSNEEARARLKKYTESQLQELPGIEIVSHTDGHHSNFILSFRFHDLDNRQIADHLWRQPKPITLSYIARSNLLRISFDQFNTEEEIDFLIESLQEAVAKEQEKNIGGKDESK